jgi:hypothetical protein
MAPFHPFPSGTALRLGVIVCALDEKVQQVRIMVVTRMLRILAFTLIPFDFAVADSYRSRTMAVGGRSQPTRRRANH